MEFIYKLIIIEDSKYPIPHLKVE